MQRNPRDLGSIIRRLKVSIPILNALKLDGYMRQMVLSQLVEMCQKENQQIILPESIRVQTVPDDDFPKIIDAYAGVTPDNIQQVS